MAINKMVNRMVYILHLSSFILSHDNHNSTYIHSIMLDERGFICTWNAMNKFVNCSQLKFPLLFSMILFFTQATIIWKDANQTGWEHRTAYGWKLQYSAIHKCTRYVRDSFHSQHSISRELKVGVDKLPTYTNNTDQVY